MLTHLRRLLDRLRGTPQAYPGVVFTEQHTPEQVTTYEVAREILGRQLGEALAAADASSDPAARQRAEDQAAEIEIRRQTMRVGSAEADQIVAAAKATRAALAHG